MRHNIPENPTGLEKLPLHWGVTNVTEPAIFTKRPNEYLRFPVYAEKGVENTNLIYLYRFQYGINMSPGPTNDFNATFMGRRVGQFTPLMLYTTDWALIHAFRNHRRNLHGTVMTPILSSGEELLVYQNRNMRNGEAPKELRDVHQELRRLFQKSDTVNSGYDWEVSLPRHKTEREYSVLLGNKNHIDNMWILRFPHVQHRPGYAHEDGVFTHITSQRQIHVTRQRLRWYHSHHGRFWPLLKKEL